LLSGAPFCYPYAGQGHVDVDWVKRLRPMAAGARRRYYTWRLSDMHRRGIAALSQHPGPALDEATRREALTFLGTVVRGYRDLRWHQYYARVNGRPSAQYLPDDIFYALAMPVLNPKDRAAILGDKNHFDRIEGWPALPATVGRLMNGRLLDPHFRPATTAELVRQLPRDSQLVVKPSRVTGGGKGLAFVEAGALAGALDGRSDAIVQLPVVQHRDLAVLNASSLNTMRVTTYRKLDGEVLHLGSFLRMGRSGSRVDNASAGGIYCGIDAERGVLGADAYNKDGSKVFQAHPDNGLLFAERKIPAFAAIREAYIAAHRQTPWIDLASWDVAIDTTGQPVTIEINVGTTISVLQIPCGPIFAPVMDDIRKRIGSRRYARLLGFY